MGACVAQYIYERIKNIEEENTRKTLLSNIEAVLNVSPSVSIWKPTTMGKFEGKKL
jgi:hypothetical protein